jgi:uncharacterized membrane protein YkvA (DUF1232 family)
VTVDSVDAAGWSSGPLFGLGIGLLFYVTFVGFLYARGKKQDARAWAGFIPDCVVLGKRLLADETVPRRAKVVLALLVVYLAMPIDLVPDFIPFAGQADDAIVAGLALRYTLRFVPPGTLETHWPGPAVSLRLVMRLAGHRN